MKKVKSSLSDAIGFPQIVPTCWGKETRGAGAYFAEHGSDDARPVAVQQALLIDGVMTYEVFHHQQEGSDAVSL